MGPTLAAQTHLTTSMARQIYLVITGRSELANQKLAEEIKLKEPAQQYLLSKIQNTFSCLKITSNWRSESTCSKLNLIKFSRRTSRKKGELKISSSSSNSAHSKSRVWRTSGNMLRKKQRMGKSQPLLWSLSE